MTTIKNIYCVGRNYAQHAKELNNAVPTSPFLFSKPTHSLVQCDEQTITLPGNRGAVHYEVELVIHIGKAYEKGIKADEIIDQMALGIDFTLRDVQNELKEKGYPWLLAKGFPNSALVTKLIPFPGVEECQKIEFSLDRNGVEAQRGNIKDMLFPLQTIIDFTAEHFGLGEGDILFTGTPAGVGRIEDGDQLSLRWGQDLLGECKIVLK